MKHKTEEFDENYKTLFAAIYKQAVADDIREVKKKVEGFLKSEGVNRRRILKYLDSKKEDIEDSVRIAVYAEAQHFGGKTRKMQSAAIGRITDRMIDEFYGR